MKAKNALSMAIEISASTARTAAVSNAMGMFRPANTGADGSAATTSDPGSSQVGPIRLSGSPTFTVRRCS
jgi:hypothetical protein